MLFSFQDFIKILIAEVPIIKSGYVKKISKTSTIYIDRKNSKVRLEMSLSNFTEIALFYFFSVVTFCEGSPKKYGDSKEEIRWFALEYLQVNQ